MALLNYISLILAEDSGKWWEESADAIEAIKNVLGPLLGMVAVAGIIYVIVLSVNYVKAQDGGKRGECMTRLKNAIIGFVVLMVTMALFIILLDNIAPIMEWLENIVGEGSGFSGSSGGGGGGGTNTTPSNTNTNTYS